MTNRGRGPGRFVGRFEGKAEAYSKYRPRYPDGILRRLKERIGFGQEWVVADIGSGTGILSELFLRNGNSVYCIEPNGDMRRAAEKGLGRYGKKFVSIDGTAEDTGLASSSVDLVTVGQALHWFDAERARAEFGRVLVRDGYVAVVYNYRRERGRVEEAYARLVKEFGKAAEVPEVDDDYVAGILSRGKVEKFVMPNSQRLDVQGVLGRLASASYMPKSNSSKWAGIAEEVGRIVHEYGHDGGVVLHYVTTLRLGRVPQDQCRQSRRGHLM